MWSRDHSMPDLSLVSCAGTGTRASLAGLLITAAWGVTLPSLLSPAENGEGSLRPGGGRRMPFNRAGGAML